VTPGRKVVRIKTALRVRLKSYANLGRHSRDPAAHRELTGTREISFVFVSKQAPADRH
jgi:hypothetical protein